jgi:hypothetical protein
MCVGEQRGAQIADLLSAIPDFWVIKGVTTMKKTRGGRMTAAKRRAAKAPGGRGLIKNRKAGRKIMKT